MPSAPKPRRQEELTAALRLLVRARGELTARFSGSSMRPSLPDGADLVLRGGAPVSVGDIVAFVADGSIVLHRVEAVSKRGFSLLTRGDALWLPDPLVRDPGAVLGVVTGVRHAQSVEPAPPPRSGALRCAVLWPFRLALAASPGLVAAALGGLHGPRRFARAALGQLRARLRRPW